MSPEQEEEQQQHSNPSHDHAAKAAGKNGAHPIWKSIENWAENQAQIAMFVAFYLTFLSVWEIVW